MGAAMLLVEIGDDMGAFGTPAKLASWAGVCPGNNESAGKKKSGKARKMDQHPMGGIIFRGEKGKYPSGYECQIRNGFREKDPSQPVDSGTGGIVDHQAARKIIVEDAEFFYETIEAHGRHLAVWINGLQVTNFTDLNPEGLEVTQSRARVKAGILGLQVHGSTTNLDFRNLRIAEFPVSPIPQP